MRCSKCGNEVQPGELFCGQCGAPFTAPVSPRANVSPHQSQVQSGPIPVIYPNGVPTTPPQPRSLSPRLPNQPPRQPYSTRPGSSAGHQYPSIPQAGAHVLSGPNQQGEFYHDSTAAFQVNQQYAVIPGSQPRQISQAMPVLPTHGEQKVYSQSQSTDRTATTSGITASQKAQTYPANNPGSGSKTNQHRTIQRQPHSAIVMTICICLVIALISIIGLLTYMWSLGNHNGDTAQPSHPTTPVTGAPSMTPTQLSTPTTVVTPTPSLDSGFTWCSSTCTTADFMTEYPTRWIVTTLPMPGNGMQISNASQSHTMASFKAELPPTSTTTASEILLNEITMNYARNPGYQASNSNQTATICGETWTTAILYYQDNAQKERVEVYATIHNSKAYVIALQAPDDQFDTIYSQYYSAMLNKYQFLPSGTA